MRRHLHDVYPPPSSTDDGFKMKSATFVGRTGAVGRCIPPVKAANALLEDEEDLAPHVRRHMDFLLANMMKTQLDIAGAKNVVGEPAHGVRHVAEEVVFGVYGPNDVAHGMDAGDLGDTCKSFSIGADFVLLEGHFGEWRSAEIGADIVVQVGGDAGAHAFQFEELADA